MLIYFQVNSFWWIKHLVFFCFCRWNGKRDVRQKCVFDVKKFLMQKQMVGVCCWPDNQVSNPVWMQFYCCFCCCIFINIVNWPFTTNAFILTKKKQKQQHQKINNLIIECSQYPFIDLCQGRKWNKNIFFLDLIYCNWLYVWRQRWFFFVYLIKRSSVTENCKTFLRVSSKCMLLKCKEI